MSSCHRRARHPRDRKLIGRWRRRRPAQRVLPVQITRAIGAASALGARGRTCCKRQVSSLYDATVCFHRHGDGMSVCAERGTGTCPGEYRADQANQSPVGCPGAAIRLPIRGRGARPRLIASGPGTAWRGFPLRSRPHTGACVPPPWPAAPCARLGAPGSSNMFTASASSTKRISRPGVRPIRRPRRRAGACTVPSRSRPLVCPGCLARQPGGRGDSPEPAASCVG
jgi:hypothetical protein